MKTRTAQPRRRSMAITTTIAGVVTYRTRKPLPPRRAKSFASALSANPRFLDVTLVRSRKDGHYHVCFLPSNTDRILAMLDAEDAKDIANADRDGHKFVYTETARSQVFQCVGIDGTYSVTLSYGGRCDCPHFKYRRNCTGGRCKHMIELERRQEAGLLMPEPINTPCGVWTPAPIAAPTFGGYGSPTFAANVARDFD